MTCLSIYYLANDNHFSALISQVKSICKFPTESETARIISGLRWIGLFSQEKIKPRAGNLLDTLCAQLETLMKYEEGERDLVMLQHKFIVEWKDGSEVSRFLLLLGRCLTLPLLSKPSHLHWRPMATQVATPLWH